MTENTNCRDGADESLSGRVRAWLAFCWSQALAIHASSGSFLEAERKNFAQSNRGQTNLVQLVIGIMIAGIVIMQVFIPVMQDASSNLSGTEGTIADLIPLFAVLMLLVALASPLMTRV